MERVIGDKLERESVGASWTWREIQCGQVDVGKLESQCGQVGENRESWF